MQTNERPVLEAKNVSKDFLIKTNQGKKILARVVENVSLSLYPGTILGLVGESGCGKTTLARMLGFAFEPTQGEILLGGQKILARRVSRKTRRRVQLMFQDPFGSLNRLQTLRYILGRPLRLHGYAKSNDEVKSSVANLLELIGLTPPEAYLDRRPDDLSGGQRQRVVIARALAVNPDVILADEPVSMLDVSIRLEILDLLQKLRNEQKVAFLYITHDIASARHISGTIAVMYAGRLIEGGLAGAVIDNPFHPYTRLLVESTPDTDGRDRAFRGKLAPAAFGEPPSLVDPPSGCRFHPRCPFALEKCSISVPEIMNFENRWVACWNPLNGVFPNQNGGIHEILG